MEMSDEYYVRTENPTHMVDIVNSTLELRRDSLSGLYTVVAILGSIPHVLVRSESRGHCYRVFKELKHTKQAIIRQMNTESGRYTKRNGKLVCDFLEQVVKPKRRRR